MTSCWHFLYLSGTSAGSRPGSKLDQCHPGAWNHGLGALCADGSRPGAFSKRKRICKAAHALGCSDGRIIFKQILPSVIDSAIILGTMDIGTIILSEASLTFLGLGIPPNIATWGNMIANGNDYIFSAGWLTMIPGIALLIGCISINFVGDWLRDVRDPRLRGVD